MAEPYVLLPLKKYQSLNKLPNPEPPAKITKTKDADDNDDDDDDDDNDETSLKDRSISDGDVPLGKDITDVYRLNQFKKMLKQSDPDIEKQFPNLDSLITLSLSRNSRKKVDNEKEFFDFIFKNNLLELVKNKTKIRHYYPRWFSLV